jgi:hypothetical protein
VNVETWLNLECRYTFGETTTASNAFAMRLEEWFEDIRRGDYPPVGDCSIGRGCDFRRFCRHAPVEAKAASRASYESANRRSLFCAALRNVSALEPHVQH